MVKPLQSLDIIRKFILNVDLTTKDTIVVAKNMQFIEKGLADVVISQHSLEGSTVFSPEHMGRAFTIMRHPVKLAVSLFYYVSFRDCLLLLFALKCQYWTNHRVIKM